MPPYGFLEQPYRLAMGLRALDPAAWLEVGDDRAEQMERRHQLLESRPADVVAALPESVAGQRELFALVFEHLPARFPALWQRDGPALVERPGGERFGPDPAAPLASLGRMVQEDLCLLQQGAGGYRLVAAVLCFPAHWRLADKLGRPLDVIHAPVPGFAERLAGPVDRFFGSLRVERPVWRVNWSIVDSPELFRPPGQRTRRAPERPGEALWLRVERQTLRRLPESGAVVFGIRTYVEPLAEVITAPAIAQALALRIREMPPAMAVYKGIAPIREPLLTWLERRASSPAHRGDRHSLK